MVDIYPIPEIAGYGITKDGRVWSYPKERSSVAGLWLKQSKSSAGYQIVHCGVQNKNKSVHRLMAKTFLSIVGGKFCVNHKNGIKTDNRIENLEWCSYSENNQHAQDTGLSKARYSEKQKASVRKENKRRTFLQGEFLQLLAKFHEMGLSYAKLARGLTCSGAGIHKAMRREGLA